MLQILILIFFALCFLLIALCAVSIYRNFLSQYKMSANGFLTVFVLLLTVPALIQCFGGILGTANLQEAVSALNSSPSISAEEREALEQMVKSAPGQIIMYLGIGYAYFAAHAVIIKIIQWRLDKKIRENAKMRWKI